MPWKGFSWLDEDICQNAFPGDRQFSTMDGESWESIFEIPIHFLISNPAGMSYNERVYVLERFSAGWMRIFARMHSWR